MCALDMNCMSKEEASQLFMQSSALLPSPNPTIPQSHTESPSTETKVVFESESKLTLCGGCLFRGRSGGHRGVCRAVSDCCSRGEVKLLCIWARCHPCRIQVIWRNEANTFVTELYLRYKPIQISPVYYATKNQFLP